MWHMILKKRSISRKRVAKLDPRADLEAVEGQNHAVHAAEIGLRIVDSRKHFSLLLEHFLQRTQSLEIEAVEAGIPRVRRGNADILVQPSFPVTPD